MKRWLVLISMLCLFAACEKELPLPVPSEPAKITLIGELLANDTVQLRAGQSNFLGSTPELPRGMQIILKDSSGLEIPLQERADPKMYVLHTLTFSNATSIEAGKKYSILATHPSLGDVNATISVPRPFTATLISKQFTSYAGDSVLNLDIDLNDAHAGDAQYVVEIVRRPINISGYFLFQAIRYTIRENRALFDSLRNAGLTLSGQFDTTYLGDYNRQTFYSDDELNETGAAEGRLFRRIFLSGARFNGFSHRTRIRIPKSNLTDESGQFVKIVLYVKSVSKDYFDFLIAYDAYGSGADPGSNNIPKQLPGNIVGGFGMVGGVWRWGLEMVY